MTDGSANADADRALERSTLAKASWRLLPMIALGYGISYIDRVNISFAAATMNADLGFSATVYGFGGGLFFLSYAAFEVPSNLLLVRVGARRWLARIMVTWGLIAVGMMFVRTDWQFYAMRFLLGLAEAGFFPGVIYYLTQWFPSAHRGRAISRFYVAWPLSAFVMGGLAGALLSLDGLWGLEGWQWLFLVEGLPAVAMGFVFLVFLPDNPQTVRWLSAGEKDWLARRLAADAAALAPVKHGFLPALTNPVVLQLVAINFITLGCSYAFTLSAPTILDQMTGWGPTNVGYLISFAGLSATVGILFTGWNSDRTRERYLHLTIPILMMAAGYVVLATSPPPLVTASAYVLTLIGSSGVAAAFWLVPGDLLHPRVVAVSVAAINALGSLASFAAPWLWGIAKDATGGYGLGISVLPVAYLIAAAIVLALRYQAKRRRVPAA